MSDNSLYTENYQTLPMSPDCARLISYLEHQIAQGQRNGDLTATHRALEKDGGLDYRRIKQTIREAVDAGLVQSCHPVAAELPHGTS
jgi:hypothetical protein